DALRPRADLGRAIARASFDDWRAAAKTADELQATPALTAGLHLLSEGTELAQRLALPSPHEAPWQATRYETVRPPTAEGFMRLAETRGRRAKAALLLREAFPSPTFMRLRSNRSELAQRGR